VHRRLPALALLTLLPLATALAACGGDDEPDGPGDGGTSAVAEAVEGPCRWVAPEDVSAAAGFDLSEVTSGPATCLFSSGNPSISTTVTVNYLEIAIDPTEYADGAREQCSDEPTDVEAGDVAFVCTTFSTPQGYRYDGSDSVVVDVGDLDAPAATSLLTALLPSIVPAAGAGS
jgi:hypothetical protein